MNVAQAPSFQGPLSLSALLANLSLSNCPPAASLPEIILCEGVSALRSALATAPSGILLVSPDRHALIQTVLICVPAAAIHPCTQPSPPQVSDFVLCLADVDAPCKQVEALVKGIFTRKAPHPILALASSATEVPPSLLRAGRLEKVVRLSGPSFDTRRKAWDWLLEHFAKNDQGFKYSRNASRELAQITPGCGLQDFAHIVYAILGNSERKRKNLTIDDIWDIVCNHRPLQGNAELDFVVGGGMNTSEGYSEQDWNAIGGYSATKELLQRLVEWPVRHRATFKRLGVEPSSGVLLHGAGGCGKTMLAVAFLKRLQHANWLHVSAPDLFSKYLGESEARVRQLFARARGLQPCVVFLDEVDTVGGWRGREDGTGVEKRVLGTLLTEMDGIEGGHVFVLACARSLDIIDPALLRPGRLDHLIEVGAPTFEDRIEVLRKALEEVPIGNEICEVPLSTNTRREEIITRVAGQTDKMTGADIKAICREAAMLAVGASDNVNRVLAEHFELAIKRVSDNRSSKNSKLITSSREIPTPESSRV